MEIIPLNEITCIDYPQSDMEIPLSEVTYSSIHFALHKMKICHKMRVGITLEWKLTN